MTRDIAKARLRQIAYEYGSYQSRIDKCNELIGELDLEGDGDSNFHQMIKEYKTNHLLLLREIDEIVDGLTKGE